MRGEGEKHGGGSGGWNFQPGKGPLRGQDLNEGLRSEEASRVDGERRAWQREQSASAKALRHQHVWLLSKGQHGGAEQSGREGERQPGM